MTSLQIYGLVAPFVLAGLGWALAWWNLHTIEQHRRGNRNKHSQPAE